MDMAKAYARLEWEFLLKAMESFGFSSVSRDLIYRNICNIVYNNGVLAGSFRSARGVKQGDPLSLLLFVLAQQVLSHNIKTRIFASLITNYKVGWGEMSISHLLHVDDVLISGMAQKLLWNNLCRSYRHIKKSSGQLISPSKSGFYVHDKFQRRASVISHVTWLNRCCFPFTYLGIPIF